MPSTAPLADSTGDSPAARVRISGPLRRLLYCLAPATVGLYSVYGAVPGILLPLQVGALDEQHKAANLALVATLGAFAAMIAQPVAGALSDRTHSRFGRRAPWLVMCSVLGGLAMVGLALGNSLATIALAWMAAQIAYNFVQAPLTAVLPDRVPSAARGRFASVIGGATMIGALAGSGVASQFSDHLSTGYLAFAGLALIGVTVLVVLSPDTSSLGLPREPFRLLELLRSFWISPRRHPDFAWAFLSRLLLYTGYFTVFGYMLYLLQDYVGMSEDKAADMTPLVSVAGLPAILVSIAVCGPLSDRIGRRKPFVFASSVLVAAGLVIPWMVPSVTGVMLCSVVSGLGFGAFQAVDTALMSEVLPSSESAAKDLGVVNIAATLPQTVAPAVAGAIVVGVGYAGLFPVAAVLSVLGACAVFPIKGVK
ncbi:MFS transporter [Streptomyces beijiangensis]|uniref:MFS transporter n=1 Tax=Streptomyces beijiangensis TaxID=163361 RepID=UPI0031DBEF71